MAEAPTRIICKTGARLLLGLMSWQDIMRRMLTPFDGLAPHTTSRYGEDLCSILQCPRDHSTRPFDAPPAAAALLDSNENVRRLVRVQADVP